MCMQQGSSINSVRSWMLLLIYYNIKKSITNNCFLYFILKMRAPRFIFHNNIIEQYKLEEYNDHKRRMDEIESMKSTIYKSIENNKSLS